MSWPPSPDPTLTPEQVAAQREDVLRRLREAGERRAAAEERRDFAERIQAYAESSREIAALADEAYGRLGLSTVTIAEAVGVKRQRLHLIRKRAAAG